MRIRIDAPRAYMSHMCIMQHHFPSSTIIIIIIIIMNVTLYYPHGKTFIYRTTEYELIPLSMCSCANLSIDGCGGLFSSVVFLAPLLTQVLAKSKAEAGNPEAQALDLLLHHHHQPFTCLSILPLHPHNHPCYLPGQPCCPDHRLGSFCDLAEPKPTIPIYKPPPKPPH